MLPADKSRPAAQRQPLPAGEPELVREQASPKVDFAAGARARDGCTKQAAGGRACQGAAVRERARACAPTAPARPVAPLLGQAARAADAWSAPRCSPGTLGARSLVGVRARESPPSPPPPGKLRAQEVGARYDTCRRSRVPGEGAGAGRVIGGSYTWYGCVCGGLGGELLVVDAGDRITRALQLTQPGKHGNFIASGFLLAARLQGYAHAHIQQGLPWGQRPGNSCRLSHPGTHCPSH